MSSLGFVGTNGSESPTKAIFPFLQAMNAIDAGMKADIALVGDAVVLMRDTVADSIVPVGWPPLKELFAECVKRKIPIFV